jgi:hypothetical protein
LLQRVDFAWPDEVRDNPIAAGGWSGVRLHDPKGHNMEELSPSPVLSRTGRRHAILTARLTKIHLDHM